MELHSGKKDENPKSNCSHQGTTMLSHGGKMELHSDKKDENPKSNCSHQG